MESNEVYDYVRQWLISKKINIFYSSKKEEHKRYIRMTEENLYQLCIDLINLMENNS